MINKQQIEMLALKHLTTSVKAIEKAISMGITEDHFLYIDPQDDINYHAELFGQIMNYYNKSNSLLTTAILENKLAKSSIQPHIITKIQTIWYDIQDLEYNENETYYIFKELKELYAFHLFQNSIEELQKTIINQGIENIPEVLDNYSIKIKNQLNEFVMQSTSFNMNSGSQEFKKEFLERKNNPQKFQGLKCGIPDLDEATFGFLAPQLIVILSHSSGGKSVQLLNWAHQFNLQGKNILYFAFEMQPWICKLRHLSLKYKISYNALKKLNLSQEELETLCAKLDSEPEFPYFEYETDITVPTCEYVESRIKELISKDRRPDVVVIDYVGKMTDYDVAKGAQDYQIKQKIADKLFTIMKKYNLIILTAQQVNRESIIGNRRLREKGKEEIFDQASAAGSQNLIHHSDYTILLKPDFENKINVYYPIKMRDSIVQKFCTAYDPDTYTILPLSKEDQDNYFTSIGQNRNSEINNNRSNIKTEINNDVAIVKTDTCIEEFEAEKLTYTSTNLISLDWNEENE